MASAAFTAAKTPPTTYVVTKDLTCCTHRSIARELLGRAVERDAPMGRLCVISAEGLIAFKLQGLVNETDGTAAH